MHGQDVTLNGVSMRYPNGFVAVEPTDLTIRAGEFFSILGPSGCGKTTILRMISGFLDPTTGSIAIGGRPMDGIGPNQRPTALIFQNLALFPLMSVRENVAFGLEARGMAKAERRRRADDLLSLVALEGQGDKKPGELSGGQRQRVAVARALAVEPAVLLLDEPLSALDLKLRQHMRAELKDIQRKTGVTFIYITHDQGEALTMSDRIAVMNRGRIEQVGPGEEIYNAPATAFAATFVGEQNRFTGTVVDADSETALIETPLGRLSGLNRHGLKQGENAHLFVRPERMAVALNGHAADLDNRLDARLERRDLEGPFLNLFLRAGDMPLTLHVTNAGDGMTLEKDAALPVGFRRKDAIVLRAEG
ncbi:ABC transporter ATP-binding protein [Zhengella mangrovi]|uniref:ABC transporter ATP-binding protein n=1 Tax=Zhengella mangrovi TaxID=1982044 RepID=A0A2G1QNA5_9HYPH|nr:ABC transporter ATP-binding protein [Zhengella mangrovi]PHP66959.1 ABC transporter ATP-binding protein [Zhengella mangrovi]